jgi:OOP family OmpA-OmpF porin
MLKHSAAMAASLMLLVGPVSAQASGFYVGASIGNATLNEDFDGLQVDDNSTAFRIVGGWRFNDYFALEGGYHDFGDFKQDFDIAGTPGTAKISADGFTFGAAGSIPVSERFALTGRAGAFFWNGSAEINNVSQATPEDSNLYLGAGVSFDVSKSFQLTTDWTRYELESASSGVFSVGLQYQFR